MSNDQTRALLENAIISKLHLVNFRVEHQAWIDSKEYDTFLWSWESLVEYYKENGRWDQNISLTLVDAYLEQTDLLATIMRNDRLGERPVENARIALTGLQYWMREVMKYASTYNEDE